ncbi:MAG: AraC family transcriptional regulator [Methylococcales bacterium]
MADLIESILSRLSLRTRVFHRGIHCGDWQLDLEQSDKVLFHFVSEGSCIVELAEQKKIIGLVQGDMLLFLKPGKHVLRATKTVGEENNNQRPVAQEAPNNNASGLICAYVEFDTTFHNPLFKALPSYVVAKAKSHSDITWLKHLLGLLFAEASSNNTASQTVIERLTDILFIHIIRTYLSSGTAHSGILAAYNDPGLRAVLELMHENPQKPWSIADFSAVANLSRSAFIEKFSRTLEVPPMTYLTQQRLDYAYRQLSEGRCKIIDVALDCGYENESSFSKAFKRMYGITPGTLNRIL